MEIKFIIYFSCVIHTISFQRLKILSVTILFFIIEYIFLKQCVKLLIVKYTCLLACLELLQNENNRLRVESESLLKVIELLSVQQMNTREINVYHETIIRRGITCNKISCYMQDSACRWLIVENAKMFRRNVKTVIEKKIVKKRLLSSAISNFK